MTPRKHLVLIIHGGRADNAALRAAVERARKQGHAIDPKVTWEPADAVSFARESAARGVDAVVAVGGDGTVNEVVNGLDGSDVPLGIVPLGTANDFARQAGIPSDPALALDLIVAREAVRVDTAQVNGRRYLNVSTGGIGAEATADTPAEAKEALGFIAYAITGVRKLVELTPRRAYFAGPGFEYRGDFLLFAVGNGRATGAGTVLTPRASVTDGRLDLCIVEGMPRADFARLALKLKRGDHVGEAGVHYAQLPEVLVQAQDSMSVNADGEPSDAHRLEYRARPGDLRIHVGHLPGAEGD
jgi:diacylglycerol kinase (ATP)